MAITERIRGSSAAGRTSTAQGWLGRRMTGVISFLAFVLLWQLIVIITQINPILLPAPGSVVREFIESAQDGILGIAVVESLQALFIGLVLALVAGVILGLVIGASSWLDLIAAPYLWAFFATPRIATAGLFVLWLGFGLSAKITLVFLSALLPVILSCKEGVQTVDESLIRAARSFGAGRVQLFKHVVVPFTLPFIANAIRNGISRGFVGLLVVEMFVGSGGIGYQVIRSMSSFNTARMFAFVAVLIVTALVLITLSRKLENRVSAWRGEVYV